MRREGTRNLLAAAEEARASRLSRRALPGIYPATLERRSPNSNGWCSRQMELFSGTDGCTALHLLRKRKPEPPRVHVDEGARRTVPALCTPSGILEVTDGRAMSFRVAVGLIS